MDESPEGEGKQRESTRCWMSEELLCRGRRSDSARQGLGAVGKLQLGARRCQAEGWLGPFVALALSHVFNDPC